MWADTDRGAIDTDDRAVDTNLVCCLPRSLSLDASFALNALSNDPSLLVECTLLNLAIESVGIDHTRLLTRAGRTHPHPV